MFLRERSLVEAAFSRAVTLRLSIRLLIGSELWLWGGHFITLRQSRIDCFFSPVFDSYID